MHIKSSTLKLLGTTALGSAAALAIAFIASSISPLTQPGAHAETTIRGNASTDLVANIDSTLILSVAPAVEIDITPDASRTNPLGFNIGSATVKVSTNDPWGYTLHMNVNTDQNPGTNPKSTALNHTTVGNKYLPSISNPTASLDTTSWGFKTDNNPTSGEPDRDKGQLLADTYYPLPTSVSPLLINQSDTVTTDHTTVVTFGAKSDPSLPAGSYENTVVFSAVANPELDTLTLQFNKNTEDTVTNLPDTALTTTVIQGSDANISLPSNVPVRAGYNFKGWSTEPSDTTGAYQPGNTYTYANLSEDTTVTLFAIWELVTHTLTVEFFADAGSDTVTNLPTTQTATVAHGQTAEITIPAATPTRTGYNFLGYATSAGGSAAYHESDTYSVSNLTSDQNAELHAIWQIKQYNFSLTYDANGGSNAPATHATSVDHGQIAEIQVSTSQPTAPSGKRFKGWSTSATGDVEYVSGATYYSNAAITGPDGATLYALYEDIPSLSNGMSMQDANIAAACASTPTWDANNASTQVTYTLKDARDNKEYAVRKLNMGDGTAKCWMVQNLAYAETNTKLTSDTSDVASGSTYTTPSAINTTAFTVGSNPQYSGDNNNQMHYDNNTAAYQAGNTASKGAYYSWYVATAGTGKNTSDTGDRASASICPKGWRLPYSDGTSTVTNEFYGIYSAYGSNRTKFNAVYPLTLAGYYYNSGLGNSGTYGYWWSSVANSTQSARYMYANSSSVNPANSSYKYYGFSVRCVLGS